MTKPQETVYLLHFSTAYKHAKHYLGYTKDLDARLAKHQAGTGARLIDVILNAGLRFTLVRTFSGGRALERQLKGHSSTRLCPICNPTHFSGHFSSAAKWDVTQGVELQAGAVKQIA